MNSPLLSKSAAIASTLAIIVVSALLGMLIDWRAPGIGRYAQDWLMRARGTLPVPEDIAIVAIDDNSIARLGRFPWPRSVMARTISAVSTAQPKAIALDVLFADSTAGGEDRALESSIAEAADVIVAAQLVEAPVPGGASAWLLPLPSISGAAAAVGHVNVLAESEGVARELLVRAADDSGRWFRAMPIETVRIGERVPEQAVVDTGRSLIVGLRVIPVQGAASPVVLGQDSGTRPAQILRAGRMAIDYIGPTGSFAPNTFSVVDVLEGRVRAAYLRGRYVLIGATAASVGERFPSPFVHQSDVQANQHGTLMPGVEVLANALNTILRSRFYSRTPDWLVFLWAALAAGLTILLLAASEGRYGMAKQLAVLGGMAGAVTLSSYMAFTRLLVIPPLMPGLVSFASAGLLGLLRRSLITSSRLDASIGAIANAGDLLLPHSLPNTGAEAIGRLTGAAGVAIFASQGIGRYVLVAQHGARVSSGLNRRRGVALPPSTASATAFFSLPGDQPQGWQVIMHQIGASGDLLVIAHDVSRPPSSESLRIGAAIATSCVTGTGIPGERRLETWRWPKGLEGKARTLASLTPGFSSTLDL